MPLTPRGKHRAPVELPPAPRTARARGEAAERRRRPVRSSRRSRVREAAAVGRGDAGRGDDDADEAAPPTRSPTVAHGADQTNAYHCYDDDDAAGRRRG